MATTTKPFDNYTVQIRGGTEGRIALLLCYQGASYVGRIAFYEDGTELVPDYLFHPGTQEEVRIIMPMKRFGAVMSIVRNEKPLALYIDVDRGPGAATIGHGHLITSEREPVGEEEGTP